MNHSSPTPWLRRRGGALLLAVLIVQGCSVNPATGRRQFSMIGEGREVALGQENDKAVIAQIGLYEDEALQAWIQQLGVSIAARSERPELPWTFRVVNDPAINAFALPGGYIYVTRGILAHFGSEAELASVLGHEIGHVTGRHSVARMSSAQLASLGFGVAMIALPELRPFGNAAQQGLGLMFLKFSRDDEREADDLGLRYMTRADYAAEEMPKVFDTLARTAEASEGQRLPSWMSTHPAPPERAVRMREAIAALPAPERGHRVERDSYLARIDGIVYGENPREGFFRDNLFFHPEMRFKLAFPRGWKTSNSRQAVRAIAPDRDAAVLLGAAPGETPSQAESAFYRRYGLERGKALGSGLRTFRSPARQDGGERMVGITLFIQHGDGVLQLLAYTGETRWGRYRQAFETSLRSFADLSDPKILAVQPARIEIVRVPRSMSLAEFDRLWPSNADLDELARVNGIARDGSFPARSAVKRIVGGVPRESGS
jgi:predicted Zn-dependent protease